MTDLVQLYLCEMRGEPEEAVVDARAVSLQKFSLGVFELIANHIHLLSLTVKWF